MRPSGGIGPRQDHWHDPRIAERRNGRQHRRQTERDKEVAEIFRAQDPGKENLRTDAQNGARHPRADGEARGSEQGFQATGSPGRTSRGRRAMASWPAQRFVREYAHAKALVPRDAISGR